MQPKYGILHVPDQEEISTLEPLAQGIALSPASASPHPGDGDGMDGNDAHGTGWKSWREGFGVRLIIGWSKKHIFYEQEGREKNRWEMGRGKNYRAHQLIGASAGGWKLACDLWWAPVGHPTSTRQWYLVKARLRGSVCYLISNERVPTQEQAWEIFCAYKRRWQIETSLRYGKGELAMQSPRLWSLEKRLKLGGMVLLVSACLLFLARPGSY